MSSIYRVGVQIYGNAAGYIGTVNQTIRGTTRLSQSFRSANTQSKLFSNQMKAVGTTMRYAFAGSLVFGITGALSRLSDFSAELGTIDSLAGQLNKQGRFVGLGNQLQDLGSDAIVMSDRFGAAVTDVEQYMARFASTFERRPGESIKQYTNDLGGFTTAILQLQTALGSEAGDPSALAGGIGGLVNVIPGGRANPAGTARRLGNLVAYLTQVTPNITGTDVANAAGRFASVYNTAAITPEQLFGIYGQAAKAGGSPSIVTRGVQQLLGQSLLRPATPTNKAAYTAAGLPSDPNALRALGGFKVLTRLMEVVAPNGVSLSKRQLQNVNNATTKGQLQTALPGLNVTELYNLFGRIQSVQQFVNILSQGGVKGLQDYLRSQQKATDANLLAARSAAALRNQGLKVLSNSMSNVGLSLVRSLNGPLTQFGRLVSRTSDEMARHRTTTTAVEGAAGTAVLLRLIGKTSLGGAVLSKIPGLRRIAGLTGGLGRVAGAAVMAEESANVATGSIGADGSRSNPFWVIISPYSWQFGYGGMSQPAGGKGGGDALAGKAIKKFLPGGIGGLAARAGLSGLAGADIALGATGIGLPLAVLGAAAIYGGGKGSNKPNTLQKVLAANGKTALPGSIAGAIDTPLYRNGKIQFDTARVDITAHVVDAHGNEIAVGKKKGVPLAVTKDTPPTSQGRNGVRKGQ